jgi:hypothetical protein
MPRLSWMFRRSPDHELEVHRRQALLVLPLYLVGIVLYLVATGPLELSPGPGLEARP